MRRTARNIQFVKSKELLQNGKMYRCDKKNRELGEVYTPREVVDFIVNSCNYALNKHFNPSYWQIAFVNCYEPFCGHGNFIETLVKERIKAIFKAIRNDGYALHNLQYSPHLLRYIINSIAGISAGDIMSDNVQLSRARAYLWIHKVFRRVYKKNMPYTIAKIFSYLLRMKIVHRNTFAMKDIEIEFYLHHDDNVYYYFTHYDKTNRHKYFDKKGESYNRDRIDPFCESVGNMKGIYQHYLKVAKGIKNERSKLI